MQVSPCVPCGTIPALTPVPGPSGANAWAVVTTSFVVPTIGSNVAVSVSQTAGFIVGENLFVQSGVSGGGNFLVVSIQSSTAMTLEFLGFPGDFIATSTVPANSIIVPGPGNLITAGSSQTNSAFSTVTEIGGFTTPAIGSNVTTTLASYSGLVIGQNVYIATATASGGNFTVYSLNSGPASVTLTFLGLSGDVSPGHVFPINSILVPGIGNQTSVGGIAGVQIVNGVPTFTNGLASTKSNLAAPVSITFPATTVAWTNPNSFNIEVYIDGTSANVITALKKNGTTIFANAGNQTSFTLSLQPGETFTPTYASGSPTARYSPL